MSARSDTGDVWGFDKSWREREERLYSHWTRESPANQIQFAFRQHWDLFQGIMGASPEGARVLEVGCGRGTISAYFADAGFACSLLDSSPAAIAEAKKTFDAGGLEGTFNVGDALELPYPEGSFDVVVSIGLLEHFDEPTRAVQEQVRVLAGGGLLLAYVVPDNRSSVGEEYAWVNAILKAVLPEDEVANSQGKEDLYRSALGCEEYREIAEGLNLHGVTTSGVYPLPMVSHSPGFPFTLLPEPAERVVVSRFEEMLEDRAAVQDWHPWLCRESEGQAILIWGWKD